MDKKRAGYWPLEAAVDEVDLYDAKAAGRVGLLNSSPGAPPRDPWAFQDASATVRIVFSFA